MWPQPILRQFANIPPSVLQSDGPADYNGPYNKLLNMLFPPESDFVVVPHSIPDTQNSVYLNLVFEVFLLNKPVLVFALQPSKYDLLPSHRREADKQIRVQMFDHVG
ncbi:hypothetical protein C8J56DRAFT_990648, partial [Mycena floridula]